MQVNDEHERILKKIDFSSVCCAHMDLNILEGLE